jgi:DNA-binding MurR/RpiR family transcriptional regulator
MPNTLKTDTSAPRDLRTAIRQAQANLTASDRRLADALLADPAHVSYLSANEAAKRAGVHPTSAVRFARKLGYRDYSDLRDHLRNTVMGSNGAPAQRMEARLARANRLGAIHTVIDSDIRALQRLPQQVTDQQISTFVRAVMRANSVLVCGIGYAGILASYLALRMRRSGYPAIGLDRIDWRSEDEIAATKKGGLIICIAFRQTEKAMTAIISKAKALGMKTALITDSALTESSPDLTLAADRGGQGEAETLAVPMALCNAIILELARLDEGRSVTALDRLATVRGKK